MIENITVNDQNNNELSVEGIAYIQLLSSGKRYLLYTMNEERPDNRIKMYVGELTDTVSSLGNIPDEAWKPLRETLENISRGQKLQDVKFLSMANTIFNIGIPKKLAITAENKQAFRKQQIEGVTMDQQQMVAAPATENITVNSTENLVNGSLEPQVSANDTLMNGDQGQVNIFNNPMQPEVVTPSATLADSGQMQQADMPVASVENKTLYPLPNVDSAANDVATALESASLNDSGNSIQFQQELATNLSNDLGLTTGLSSEKVDKEVTKEEALVALETLNRYFKTTKELPSALASEINGQVQETKTSTIEETKDTYQPQVVNSPNNDNMGYSEAAQEQGRTLSLVPESIPSAPPVTTENSEYTAVNQEGQDMSNQAQIMNEQTPAYTFNQSVTPDAQILGASPAPAGYTATSNGAAIDMSATTTNISDVPVTLPDNYNPKAVANPNVIMGPGSLPAENLVKAA